MLAAVVVACLTSRASSEGTALVGETCSDTNDCYGSKACLGGRCCEFYAEHSTTDDYREAMPGAQAALTLRRKAWEL